ncbi:MAG: glucose-6-phosphate isomerase [Devosiaceae bacterium]|nr:glucose-6-phosphate isomerase [Devosiaceae bacterium]
MSTSEVDTVFMDLATHQKRLNNVHMRDLFDADAKRFARFSASCDDLFLDYSKNRIDRNVMSTLFDLARVAGVEQKRDAMWAGEHINFTENRAVQHMALRYQGDKKVLVDGHDIMPEIRSVLASMKSFVTRVRSGEIRGSNGRSFTDIISIGIGGSDLGPAMVTAALAPYCSANLKLHFVSNVDGAHLFDTLKGMDPARTMFLIASKSFTTDETMTNAASARDWLENALNEQAIGDHFAAISTNISACVEFGISEERIFGFWDWVGGRYSVCSAIGLPVALAIGFENFEQFLLGASKMDDHFRQTELEKNLPVIMALLGVWYRNAWGFTTKAVLPYDQRMIRFAAYLQQQDMESNGKRVRADGMEVSRATGPIVWGEPGTNGQHAFYQLLHQGTDIVPCDFLIAATPHEEMGDHHAKLVANCFAQSQALMQGKTLEEVLADLENAGVKKETAQKLAPHRAFPGNRPSNTLIYPKLDPATLGMLIALYEHKVFVQGIIWGINSFDQWGVELGKKLAKDLLPDVQGKAETQSHDSSTQGLLSAFHRLKN